MEFDDANSHEDGQANLPQVINSKKKFDIGPTNNARITYQRKKQKYGHGTSKPFGLVDHNDSDEDEKDGDDGAWRKD